MKLVLWDIDGTLVDTAGHGRHAFGEAYRAVLGHPPRHADLPMAGRTDHAISLELLERNGVESPERMLGSMFDALHDALAARAVAIRAEGRALPGVHAALTALGQRDDVLQSLLTGNLERNAEVKLAAFGLSELVDMEVGGYGSDHGTRSELVGVARRKAAERRGVSVEPHDTVLIGDTPLDVQAARAAGARVVAVASGPYDSRALREARPDAVLEDVSDLEALTAALGLQPI